MRLDPTPEWSGSQGGDRKSEKATFLTYSRAVGPLRAERNATGQERASEQKRSELPCMPGVDDHDDQYGRISED